MIKFEPVSKYADAGLPLPTRGTEYAAGYDFVVAEDIIIPSYNEQIRGMVENAVKVLGEEEAMSAASTVPSLDDMKKISENYRPTLVSTGMKCKLNPSTYLELSMRSSTPLKYWLVMANGEGIIDSDYYNNPDNEGEIFFQVINFSPYCIQLHKNDVIGQGIIKSYYTTYDDNAKGTRTGGFGSTGQN